jgi:hypothetical protein
MTAKRGDHPCEGSAFSPDVRWQRNECVVYSVMHCNLKESSKRQICPRQPIKIAICCGLQHLKDSSRPGTWISPSKIDHPIISPSRQVLRMPTNGKIAAQMERTWRLYKTTSARCEKTYFRVVVVSNQFIFRHRFKLSEHVVSFPTLLSALSHSNLIVFRWRSRVTHSQSVHHSNLSRFERHFQARTSYGWIFCMICRIAFCTFECALWKSLESFWRFNH